MPHDEALWSVGTAEAMIRSLASGQPETVLTE
jgi:hypothetical protein